MVGDVPFRELGRRVRRRREVRPLVARVIVAREIVGREVPALVGVVVVRGRR